MLPSGSWKVICNGQHDQCFTQNWKHGRINTKHVPAFLVFNDLASSENRLAFSQCGSKLSLSQLSCLFSPLPSPPGRRGRPGWDESHGAVVGLWLGLSFYVWGWRAEGDKKSKSERDCGSKGLVRSQEEKSRGERANRRDGSALGIVTLNVLADFSLCSTRWRVGNVHLESMKVARQDLNHCRISAWKRSSSITAESWFRAQAQRVEIQLCPYQLWFWADFHSTPNLNLLICKIGVIRILTL